MSSGLIWNFSESSQNSSPVNRLVPRNPSLGRGDFSSPKIVPSPFRRRTPPFPAPLIARNLSHFLRRRRSLVSAASHQIEATSIPTGAVPRSLPGPVAPHHQTQTGPFSPRWAESLRHTPDSAGWAVVPRHIPDSTRRPELLRHTSESSVSQGPAGGSPPSPERPHPNPTLSLSPQARGASPRGRRLWQHLTLSSPWSISPGSTYTFIISR